MRKVVATITGYGIIDTEKAVLIKKGKTDSQFGLYRTQKGQFFLMVPDPGNVEIRLYSTDLAKIWLSDDIELFEKHFGKLEEI